jgi:hypothetical protein
MVAAAYMMSYVGVKQVCRDEGVSQQSSSVSGLCRLTVDHASLQITSHLG